MNARTLFTVTDEEQDRKDEIEEEKDRLVKRLGIDFFLEAITESDELSECVQLYKSGDTLLLGLAVREIVDQYIEKCSKGRTRYRI